MPIVFPEPARWVPMGKCGAVAAVLCCLCTWGTISTCRAESISPATRWRVGDRWALNVVEYSQGYVLAHSDPDYRYVHKVLQEFPMSVAVTGVVEVDGRRCWRLEMKQEEIGAEWIERMVAGELFVAVEGGLLLRASTLGKHGRPQQLAAAPFGGKVVVDNGSYSLPLNLFAAQALWNEGFSRGEKQEPNSAWRAVATKTRITGAATAVEVRVLDRRLPSPELVRVRQEWKDGASWWSKQEVWRSGYIEMVATLVEEARAEPDQPVDDDARSAARPGPPPERPLDPPPATSTFPWLTVLVCLAAVVVACGLGIWLRRRKARP